MDIVADAICCVELQSDTQDQTIPETDQAANITITIDKTHVAIPNTPEPHRTALDSIIRTTDCSGGSNLAGASVPEFHRYIDMPLELRARIMEVNMFEDKIVSDPRNPEEDECFGNYGQVFEHGWTDDDDEEEEEEEEEEGDPDEEACEGDRHHTHVYLDHQNFAWKVRDDSEVRRSHRPLIPYFKVSKECKEIVESFLTYHMGRRRRLFWSPELRKLPLSPQADIFYIDDPLAWEAVNEWGSGLLRASHDALQMRKFLVDFTTFHGLVVPSMRYKDQFLLELSNKEPFDYFRGESSMAAIFKNASHIHVVSNVDSDYVTDYRGVVIHDDENAPGLTEMNKAVLQSVWRGENSEFNGLRSPDNNLPRVLWMTTVSL